MNYRPATPADLHLLAVFNEHLIEDERADTRLSLRELESRMQTWLDTDYQAAIFEVDAVPIGYALFRPQEHGIYLRQFFIARHARRRGLGRMAVSLLLRDVLPKGCRVTLEVLDHNEAGLAFWQALGFVGHAQTLKTHT